MLIKLLGLSSVNFVVEVPSGFLKILDSNSVILQASTPNILDRVTEIEIEVSGNLNYILCTWCSVYALDD